MRTVARVKLDAEQFRTLVSGGEVKIEGEDTWHDLSSGAPSGQPYTVQIILEDMGFAEMLRMIRLAAGLTA